MEKKPNRSRGIVCLFMASLIWGTAFVAQRVGMDYVGPFTFNAVRSLVGAAVLVPVIFILRNLRRKHGEDAEWKMRPEDWRTLALGGLACGSFLCIASNLQQVGILYTTVGKAGFITALYIVAVPLLGIALGKRAGLRTWVSVAAAVTGLYLLCMTEKLTINRGDMLELACAVAFAFQILAVDYFGRRTDGTMLSCAQFLVSGLLSAILMFWTEEVHLLAICQAAVPILYAGVFSCGVAYTLQIVGQRELKPTLAALIMSFESVISALAGWLILGQKLSGRELAGCVVMFAAILLAQMPEPGNR